MHLHLATQVFKRLTHRKTYVSGVRREPVRCICVCHQVEVLNLLCSYFYFMVKIFNIYCHHLQCVLIVIQCCQCNFHLSSSPSLPTQGWVLLIMVGDMGEKLRCIASRSDVGL